MLHRSQCQGTCMARGIEACGAGEPPQFSASKIENPSNVDLPKSSSTFWGMCWLVEICTFAECRLHEFRYGL